MMPRPSPQCLPNLVTIARAAFVQSASAGRNLLLVSSPATVRCSVQSRDSTDVDENMRETRKTDYVVIFHDDQSLNVRDQLTWLDVSPPKTLVVEGYRERAGRLRTWTAECVERA